MIQLEYIWHDGFRLRRPGEWCVVFDWWRDPRCGDEGSVPGWVAALPPDEALYVVVSHHHKDHLNPDVFDWFTVHPSTRYIISRDVERHCRHRFNPAGRWRGHKVPPELVAVLRPGESRNYPDGRGGEMGVTVHAYGSTDIGNSYVLELPRGESGAPLSVMHGGDLNAWIWLDESTPGEVRDALGRYESILAGISERWPSLDVVMFDVDSRIGREYWTGARMLLERVDVGTFLPMHFGLGTPEEQALHARDARDFGAYAPPGRRTQYIALQSPGDVWQF